MAQESKWSVDQTVVRLELALKAQKVPVFAEFDHDDNARKADMTLRPTHVLVFGNPKVGTKSFRQALTDGMREVFGIADPSEGRYRLFKKAREALALAPSLQPGDQQ